MFKEYAYFIIHVFILVFIWYINSSKKLNKYSLKEIRVINFATTIINLIVAVLYYYLLSEENSLILPVVVPFIALAYSSYKRLKEVDFKGTLSQYEKLHYKNVLIIEILFTSIILFALIIGIYLTHL